QTQDQNLSVASVEARPPIVVVMGHVDHGKTTLLDAIRETEVAEGEAGGITQSIGAYEVEVKKEIPRHTPRDDFAVTRKITFIDTPGHEAFFAMREHGVKVADVALLVVAADDGVQPQTEEVIKHILATKVPFIVVINKIDKPGAAVDKVKKELSEKGVLIEEWGGQVPVALVSSRDKKGIDELLDLILLVAEMEELKYSPQKTGEGYVIESHFDAKKGVVATIIVTDGVLRTGDLIVCGTSFGSVKIMEDDEARPIKEAWPSKPVRVVGLAETTPMIGEKCSVVANAAEAQKIVSEHTQKHEEFLTRIKIEPSGQPRVLSIIIKAAALGCLEALVGVLKQIKSDRVGLKLLKCDVGDITQSDVKKAETSQAKIVGFRVKAGKDILNYADQRGIEIKTFDIIYDFVAGVKVFMSQLLDPEVIKNEVGKIEILAIFKTDKTRMVVGGKIFSGKLKKGLKFEIQRKNVVVGSGKITGLQKEKEPQEEVREGNEAGLQVENSVMVEVGDILVGFEEERKYPEL
ncbi:MAG: translation initiation factor IF-2, partial [Parcubacteria group bacterium]|nr:translation initiation factor IF-2 [Parcubacteria group bacterium]